MRLSRIWRILRIEEGVIHRGRRRRWITPSSICKILHISCDSRIQQLLYYSFKIIPTLKTSYIDSASFLGNLADKGLLRSANILQIADIVRRVDFSLFLLCFRQYFAVKRVQCLPDSSAILFKQPKQLNLVPRFRRSTVQYDGSTWQIIEMTSSV